MKTKVNKLPKSEVEIEIEVSAEKFSESRKKAMAHLNEEIKLDGFRKGHAPENVLVAAVGEGKILEEMAEITIEEVLPKVYEENDIRAIGRPHIHIKKLAMDNPLEVTVHTTVAPEIDLPDYKRIAKKHKRGKAAVVTEKDIEEALKELRKMRKAKPEGEAGATEPKDEDIPPADDEFAKSLGNFTDLAELKAKLGENITLERERAEKDKHRLNVLEEIMKETPVELPDIIVDAELGMMFSELKSRVAQYGLEWDKYLAEIKKTEDDLRKEWRESAEKKAKSNILVRSIGTKEAIKITDEEMENDIAELMKRYEGADMDRVRAYVEEMLFNERVFELLENQE